MAFVFWNHFVDMVDAIEAGDSTIVSYRDFENTDIPVVSELPISAIPVSVKRFS